MIERDDEVPLKRQAELLGISRGSVYCRPEPVSEIVQRDNADLPAGDAALRTGVGEGDLGAP